MYLCKMHVLVPTQGPETSLTGDAKIKFKFTNNARRLIYHDVANVFNCVTANSLNIYCL